MPSGLVSAYVVSLLRLLRAGFVMLHLHCRDGANCLREASETHDW